MDRTVLLNVLREYDAALRANGATGLYVFGSRARGTERPDSDLDLFIDYDPAARIPNMFASCKSRRRFYAASGFLSPSTRNALHPLMKDAIERDAIRVL